MSNKLYDILNKLQRWLPAVGIFYLALCGVWGLPFGRQVNETIVALSALLAATLEIETGFYHKDVASSLISDMVGAFPDEPDESDETEHDKPEDDGDDGIGLTD